MYLSNEHPDTGNHFNTQNTAGVRKLKQREMQLLRSSNLQADSEPKPLASPFRWYNHLPCCSTRTLPVKWQSILVPGQLYTCGDDVDVCVHTDLCYDISQMWSIWILTYIHISLYYIILHYIILYYILLYYNIMYSTYKFTTSVVERLTFMLTIYGCVGGRHSQDSGFR